jgi:DNA gyrase subunit B
VREFSFANRDLNLYGEPGADASPVANDPEGVDGAHHSNGENGHEIHPVPVPRHVGHASRRRAKLVELYESAAIQKLIDELARQELHIEHYAAQDQPLFELIEGEGDRAAVRPIFSIPEILERVKENGRRGVQIKRFKGLGEMNAKELFDTTMDPAKRKLLRVDLNDDNSLRADNMFTVLMGDVVEPRRQFIEDNALNVRNLDV